MENNPLTGAILGAAIEVHERLGPRLLESAYRACLSYELRKRGFKDNFSLSVPSVSLCFKIYAPGYHLQVEDGA